MVQSLQMLQIDIPYTKQNIKAYIGVCYCTHTCQYTVTLWHMLEDFKFFTIKPPFVTLGFTTGAEYCQKKIKLTKKSFKIL